MQASTHPSPLVDSILHNEKGSFKKKYYFIFHSWQENGPFRLVCCWHYFIEFDPYKRQAGSKNAGGFFFQ